MVFMIYENIDEVTKEPFESLLNRYLIRLKTSMNVGDFIRDSVRLVYYKCHEINLNRGWSYIDPLDWMKNKKTTINPINKKR